MFCDDIPFIEHLVKDVDVILSTGMTTQARSIMRSRFFLSLETACVIALHNVISNN